MVGAAAAADTGRGIGKLQHLIQREHGTSLPCIVTSGHQSRAEGTHQSGNVRTGCLHTGDLLKGPEYCLIVEGSALNNDMSAKIRGRGQFDHLIQGIFDHGIGKSRGNIRNTGTFLLGLLDVGIHKHRAAGTQIHGSLGKKGLPGKALSGISQRSGEVLNKRAAAGGAGLIQQDRINGPVFQLDALHILAANIQNAVHLRVKEGGRGTVGNGFHHALIQGESGFQQGFTVAGGTAPDDFCGVRKQLFQFSDRVLGSQDGIALVIGIEPVQKLAVLTDQHKLRGSGTGINAQETISLIGRDLLFPDHGFAVPGLKIRIFLFIPEQRSQTGHLKGDLYSLLQLFKQSSKGDRLCILRLQSRAHGCEKVGILRIHRGFFRQIQGADERCLQLCKEMQRTSQKRYTATDRLSAGKS